MKFIRIACLLLFASLCLQNGYSQFQTNIEPEYFSKIGKTGLSEDSIYWKADRKLEQADFKGTPKSGRYAGLTYAGIKLHFEDKDTSYIVTVKTFFVKPLSWIKADSSGAVLSHEQGHFDLEEIYSRKIRKMLVMRNYTSIPVAKFNKAMNERINNLYVKICKEAEERQDQYDKETNHSINVPAQNKWKERIKNELEQLKDYAE